MGGIVSYDLFDTGKIRRVTATNFISYPKGFIHPDRIMDCHDIVCYMRGECIIYQDNECFSVKSGDVVVLPAGRHHYSFKPSSADTLICYLHFDALPTDQLCNFNDIDAFKFINDIDINATFHEKVLLPTLIHTQNNKGILNIFEEIATSYISYTPLIRHRANIMATKLLLELQSLTTNQYSETNLIIQQAIKLMREKMYNSTIEEIADALFISPSTLGRQFKKITGMSFHQYFLYIRLNISCQMMKNSPHISIREIALSLGFYDEFHYSKYFKKRFGFSPSSYRTSLLLNVPIPPVTPDNNISL